MRSDISELKEMRSDVNELKEDVRELKEGQKRLEEGQERLQKNLIHSLGSYTEKIIDHVDDKTAALNRRVYNVETDIQRISRQ
jgi:hemerythrin-like domain-containing protein